MPTEDRYLMTRKELISRIDVLLGGRAAEQLIFEEISTGAANDLVKSTDIAKNMITEYGMSEKFRNVTLSKPRGQFIFPGETLPREYSEATQQYVDEEVARIIDERYRHVLTLLKEKIGLLNSISAQLLEEEIIGEDKFKELISEG
jgi:cell division protease FtsH